MNKDNVSLIFPNLKTAGSGSVLPRKLKTDPNYRMFITSCRPKASSRLELHRKIRSAFLTPGSGIQDSEQVFFQILDLGPGSQTHIFESFVKIFSFWLNNFLYLLKFFPLFC